MKKKFVVFTVIICLISVLAGCNWNEPRESPPSLKPEEEARLRSEREAQEKQADDCEEATNLTADRSEILVRNSKPTDAQTKALTAANIALLNEILKSEKEGSNVLISPLSINMALGMTESGADGETLKQMEKIMNGDISQDDYDVMMAYMIKKLNESEDVSWNVANSVWINNNTGFKTNQHFLDMVNSYYKSEVWKAAFGPKTADKMNEWCNDNTHGMIPKVIDELDPMSVMVLMNAIAFEGKWETPYEPEMLQDDMRFYNADGSYSEITMMKSVEEKYISLNGGEGFVKPYKGGEYVFVGILPKDGQTTQEYIESLKTADLAKAIRDAKKDTVHVAIPEFDLDYNTNALISAYKALGMDLPFDENRADFSKMKDTDATDNGTNLYIGNIIHKTHIEVDAEGTKAAAVTAVIVEANGIEPEPDPDKYVILNSPFVYAIADAKTGMPIFIGCQNTMAE
jgi:serpin B